MPQVDKATFFPIVFWSFVLYTGGYLVLNLTFLFRFLSAMKITTKRAVAVSAATRLAQRFASSLTLFPLISL